MGLHAGGGEIQLEQGLSLLPLGSGRYDMSGAQVDRWARMFSSTKSLSQHIH